MFVLFLIILFVICSSGYLFKLFINKTDNLKNASKISQIALIASYVLATLYFIYLILLMLNIDYFQENVLLWHVFILIYCIILYYLIPLLIIYFFTNKNIILSGILYGCYLIFSAILFIIVTKRSFVDIFKFYFSYTILHQYLSFESAVFSGLINGWGSVVALSNLIYPYFLKFKNFEPKNLERDLKEIDIKIGDKKNEMEKNPTSSELKNDLIKLENQKIFLETTKNNIIKKGNSYASFMSTLLTVIFAAQSLFFIYGSLMSLKGFDYSSKNKPVDIKGGSLISAVAKFSPVTLEENILRIIEKIVTYILFANYFNSANSGSAGLLTNLNIIFDYLPFKSEQKNDLLISLYALIIPLTYFTSGQFFIGLIQDLELKHIIISKFFEGFDFGRWNKAYDLVYIGSCIMYAFEEYYYYYFNLK